MTTKLYDLDAYQTSFDSTVVKVCPAKDGMYEVLLKECLFFPIEGGQDCDRGTLNGYDVEKVELKGEDLVLTLAHEFKENESVHGEIDWNHRYLNMQMHTAEHVFSGLVHNEFGYENVGFHLSESSATMDYNGVLSDEDVASLELKANQLIRKGAKVITSFPTEAELSKLQYRSKSGIKGNVRIVEVEGIDLCACCAPHLKNISEAGLIKIISRENYKGGVRLNYLAGERAFLYFQQLMNHEITLSKALSVNRDIVCQKVLETIEEKKQLSFDMGQLRRELVKREVEASKDFFWFGEKENADLLRYVSELLKGRFLVRAAFFGTEEEGYRFLLESEEVDLTNLLDNMKKCFNLKGGGKKESIQGTIIAKKNEIIAFFAKNCENLIDKNG